MLFRGRCRRGKVYSTHTLRGEFTKIPISVDKALPFDSISRFRETHYNRRHAMRTTSTDCIAR